MAKLVTCPDCSAQLVVPLGAALDDRLRCPRCGEEFPLADTLQINIPTAELLPPLEMSFGEDDVEDTPQQSPLGEATPSSAPTLADWQERLKRAIAAGQIADEADSEEAEIDDQAGPVAQQLEPQVAASEQTAAQRSIPAAIPAGKPLNTLAKLPEFVVSESDLLPQPLSGSRAETPSLSWPAAEDFSEEFEVETLRPGLTPAEGEVEMQQEQPVAATVPQFAAATASTITVAVRPRKKRSVKFVSTMAAFLAGVVGIPLGLYALLWIKGPAGDIVHISQYLPRILLPGAFADAEPGAEGSSQLASDPRDGLAQPQGLMAAASPAESEQPLITDPAVEPASVAEPAYEGPRFAPVASADFAALLAGAQTAAPQLVAGGLSDKAALARLGQAYMTLCRLAEASSFVNYPEHSAEDERQSLVAEELFRRLLIETKSPSDLLQIAARWWEYTKRPSAGMILLGRLEQIETTPAGNLGLITLEAGNSLHSVPVLLGATPCREGELVGVVGSIVDNPAEQIPALRGQSLPVVVAHLVFDLETEPVPEPDTETLLR